jgi:Arc/MetJ family transcription regulator
MKRHTTVDLDEDLLRDAASVLGTRRTTETLHAALADVVARHRRAQLARLDLPDLTPQHLAKVRAARSFDRTHDAGRARRRRGR